jgi:hypothetical protein
VKNVKLIYHLVKEKGYTLNGAREFVKNDVNAAVGKMDTLDSLKKIKSFLIQLKQELTQQ